MQPQRNSPLNEEDMSKIEYAKEPDITVNGPSEVTFGRCPIATVNKLTIEKYTKLVIGEDNGKLAPVSSSSFPNTQVRAILTGTDLGISQGDIGQLSFIKNGHKVATMLMRADMVGLGNSHVVLASTEDCLSDSGAIFVVGETIYLDQKMVD
jgi:hypothetical protein